MDAYWAQPSSFMFIFKYPNKHSMGVKYISTPGLLGSQSYQSNPFFAVNASIHRTPTHIDHPPSLQLDPSKELKLHLL